MKSTDFIKEDYKSDFDNMINKMINDIWGQEAERRAAKQPRYLVYSQNTGMEMDTNNLEDALYAAQIISKRNLDAPSLVYDRVTKFPVVAYQGSEDMWYKTNTNSPRLHEANPKQQLSLYNPSGTTYRHEKMPTLQKDPVDKAKQLSKNIPADLSDPDEEIRQQQLKKKLDALLTSELTPREKKVLTSYYYDGKTFEKIAQEIGFSTARARQIVMKAERKLRHPERAKHLKPFLVNEADALDFAVPLNKAKASSFIDTGEIDKEKELQNLYKIIEMLPALQKKIIKLYATGNNVQEISKKLHMTPGSANYHLNQAYKFIRNYGYYDDKSGVTDLGQTQLRDGASSKYFAHAYNKAKKAGGKVIFDPATKLFYAVSKNVPGIEYIANKEYSDLQTQLKSAEQTLQQFQPKGSSIYDYWPKTDAHKAAYRNWRNIKNKMRVTAQGIPKTNKNVTEYGEVPGQRKVEFSKKNPPPFDHIYQQFIQTMLLPDNTIEPKVWIDNVNKLYGLNYTYRDFQNRGHKDYTNNWDKIVQRYILGKNINEQEKKVQEYTTKDLDLVIMFLSKQMGMSVGEVVRQYVKPMIEKGEIKVIDDEPLIR